MTVNRQVGTRLMSIDDPYQRFVWLCAGCGRRVPLHVEECRCGQRRQSHVNNNSSAAPADAVTTSPSAAKLGDLTLRESWRIASRTLVFVATVVGFIWVVSLVANALGLPMNAPWHLPTWMVWVIVVLIFFVLAPCYTADRLAILAQVLPACCSWLRRASVGRRLAIFAGFVALSIGFEYVPTVTGVALLVIFIAIGQFQEVVRLRGTESDEARA
jgi:hypothetical protein